MTEKERKNIVVRLKSNKYLTRYETDYIVDAIEKVERLTDNSSIEDIWLSIFKMALNQLIEIHKERSI